MDKLNLDHILEIVNKVKKDKGLDKYIPLYPMLRVEDDKLYIGVMLSNQSDDIWNANENFKAEYWALLDINNLNVLKINKTEDKDYITGMSNDTKQVKTNLKELTEYEVKKTLEYQEYLLNDIKNDELPIQKKLSIILNNEFEIDGEKVNIQDYIMANIEDELKQKVKELVDLLVQSKYSSITFYYNELFNQIITEYNQSKIINKDKMIACIEIMNNYYYGVKGISDFFNI